MKLQGAFTALVTPMAENGEVDYEGLEKNLEFQISQGIAGVVPVGTTGESPTLDWEEHDKVIERTIDVVNRRCRVIAGAGSNSTKESLTSAKHAAHAGADAVLLVDCYYNGPSSQELRDEYYAVVAESIPETTVVPYVIPGRTGTALAVEDLAILSSKYPNVSAVKEATGDLSRMALTRELCGQGFSILSGDDDLTYKMLTDPAIRADGVISVATNIAPGPTSEMVNAALAGNTDKAAGLAEKLAPLFGIVTVKVENDRRLPNGKTVKVADKYRNPLAIKTLMSALGIPSGQCRRPIGKMSAAGVSVVREAVTKVWRNSPEILKPLETFYGIDIESRIYDEKVWNSLMAG